MWVMALIVALAGAARAGLDCDACIAGRCHARRVLLAGFSVTDQLAIDRTRNILYTQLDHEDIVALPIDEPSIRKVMKKKSNGLAFDQINQFLYISDGDTIDTYKYGEDDNCNMSSVGAVYALGRPMRPVRLRYEDTLYTINADGSCAYYVKNSQRFVGRENLQDYNVTDMVNVRAITNWYFVSDNKLYKYVLSGYDETWHLVSDRRHVLAIGGNGDNYFADQSQKLIYKLDRATGKLKEYGSYKSGSVEDFVFDRDENIVFLDSAGSVARWVPGQEACEVAPRTETHRIDGFIRDVDYVVYFIRELQNKISSSTPTTSAEYSSSSSSSPTSTTSDSSLSRVTLIIKDSVTYPQAPYEELEWTSKRHSGLN